MNATLPLVLSILPAAPVHLPHAGPAIVRVELPPPTLGSGLPAASLTPSLGVFPTLPIPYIPSRPVVPIYRPAAEKENVKNPFPGLRAKLAAVAGKVAEPKTKNDRRREKLDGLFDGRRESEEKPVVGESVLIGLPEEDLKEEIGAY